LCLSVDKVLVKIGPKIIIKNFRFFKNSFDVNLQILFEIKRYKFDGISILFDSIQ
jgi:hypothetical protein